MASEDLQEKVVRADSAKQKLLIVGVLGFWAEPGRLPSPFIQAAMAKVWTWTLLAQPYAVGMRDNFWPGLKGNSI